MDPAGPLFYLLNPRLTSEDADFVDIIHTDAGFYGITLRSGHVDFYPNGGHRPQPGCRLINIPLSAAGLDFFYSEIFYLKNDNFGNKYNTRILAYVLRQRYTKECGL